MSRLAPTYEVLGFGEPICDYILRVSDTFLQTVPGTKWGMQPVDLTTLQGLITLSGQVPTRVAGGSSANTIKGLARLGHRVAFAGKVGRDEAGRFARSRLEAAGVTAILTESESATSQVLSIVTPNGDRTMRSFSGAGGEFTAEDLQRCSSMTARHVHIEGYAIDNNHLVEQVMTMAHAVGATISYDLGSHELVTAHRDHLLGLIENFVDILFCNRDELTALHGPDIESGCALLRQRCDMVVVLLGHEGCLVGCGQEQVRFPAYAVNLVDSTGAGDLFASGFLHGYLLGRPISECAHFGALLGSSVIQVLGAEIPETRWHQLLQAISKCS